VLHQWGC